MIPSKTVIPDSDLDYALRETFYEQGMNSSEYQIYVASIVGLTPISKEDIPDILQTGRLNGLTIKQHLKELKININY